MTLAALIRKRETGKPANDNPAKAANDGNAKDEPFAGLAALALANATSPEVAFQPDGAGEARRERVLALLRDSPSARYAVVTDTDSDPDAVIVALAIRGRASCELLVPREKWDGVLFIDLLEKHCRGIH
jgi:hypothetical protein